MQQGRTRATVAIVRTTHCLVGEPDGHFLAQGARLAVLGIAIGLSASFVLTRALSSELFGVSATDAATFLAVPALLAVVAFAATVIPAWRASSVDPMGALREE